MRREFALIIAFSYAFAAAAAPQRADQPIAVRIDATQVGAPISPYVYGQFLEHIGPIVNHGLWSEMIDDRKFFGPILDHEPPPETDPRRAFRGRTQSWMRIGSAEQTLLDEEKPYVGEHALLLRPNGQPVGVWQGDVTLSKGKQYDGHIVIAAAPDAQLTVSLVWGDGAKDRQSVSLSQFKSGYTEYPLHFSAPITTTKARFEITANGRDEVRVGVLSLMPADNVEGFRAEVIHALKELNSGVYRFPGGNFVSAHEWRDAIAPPMRWALSPTGRRSQRVNTLRPHAGQRRDEASRGARQSLAERRSSPQDGPCSGARATEHLRLRTRPRGLGLASEGA